MNIFISYVIKQDIVYMKYLEFINKNDFVGEYKFLPREEKEGFMGIAIILAYLSDGSKDLEDIANHLEVKPAEIYKPYHRLKHKGAFSTWNLKKDKALLGKLGPEETKRAYQFVAAHASGFLGNV